MNRSDESDHLQGVRDYMPGIKTDANIQCKRLMKDMAAFKLLFS